MRDRKKICSGLNCGGFGPRSFRLRRGCRPIPGRDGNRGKQSTLSDGTFTGDAPCCLVDQKNAVRFVKYNILLGNLPGSVDYFVSTGGSGGGAHASMLAATSDHPDFYDYEIAAGAVGVYKASDGSYITSVTVDGSEVPLSDGMWGCMAYSAITSLAEADMAPMWIFTFRNSDRA